MFPSSATSRPLTPNDFEVTSIVRECEDFPRKNTCTVDSDQMGVTCYSTCVTDFCNAKTPRATWDDFRRPLDPDATTVPFPDVFDEEDDRRNRGRSFGSFPRQPPPGFRPRDRGGDEEEEDNEIDSRRRPPPFGPGQFTPFAGLLRPGEYPDKEPRGNEFGGRSRAPIDDFDDDDRHQSRKPGTFRHSPDEERDNDNKKDMKDTKQEGKKKLQDAKEKSKKLKEAGVTKDKEKEGGDSPKATTPAGSKPRRLNPRGRGRIGQGKLGEAGETSKSQGEKSTSTASAVSCVHRSLLYVTVFGLSYFM